MVQLQTKHSKRYSGTARLATRFENFDLTLFDLGTTGGTRSLLFLPGLYFVLVVADLFEGLSSTS